VGDPKNASKLLPQAHRTFSNLKTWLKGAHHGVSAKHLPHYLDEFVFRFNRRRTPKNPDPARPEAPDLIRWSVQEIRRIAVRLAQRRIQPAHVIASSLWRRAHQAAARRAHLKRRTQL
jgi:hypothetical protein